jgi:hypothetical protein
MNRHCLLQAGVPRVPENSSDHAADGSKMILVIVIFGIFPTRKKGVGIVLSEIVMQDDELVQ